MNDGKYHFLEQLGCGGQGRVDKVKKIVKKPRKKDSTKHMNHDMSGDRSMGISNSRNFLLKSGHSHMI
jgi:hypothetical protein